MSPVPCRVVCVRRQQCTGAGKAEQKDSDNKRRFMVVLGGSWWFMVVHGGSWWFLVVLGGSWWFMVVLGGSWWFMVLRCACVWTTLKRWRSMPCRHPWAALPATTVPPLPSCLATCALVAVCIMILYAPASLSIPFPPHSSCSPPSPSGRCRGEVQEHCSSIR